MTEQTQTKSRGFGPTTAILLILPLILLAGVIVLFLNTGGGLQLAAPAPVEALTVERVVLEPGSINIVVRNAGPEELTIAQVIVNEAVRLMEKLRPRRSVWSRLGRWVRRARTRPKPR